MVPSKDPEYDKAKNGFIRELTQFHESRGTPMKYTPKINGKDVDLYLLYQIVTSHGGWEKINIRNEWDDLLEHFLLPRATNGGLAIKQIYLRNLELYEKIHFLGEDVDGRMEEDDDLDDSRHRRRHHPAKLSGCSTPSSQHTSSTVNTVPTSLPDHVRGQCGLSTRIVADVEYDRLIVSLQSPLPNEQDMAISVCTLLSNESKHVLKFPKAPQLLNLMLCHAGIFNDCALRSLVAETYLQGRGLNHETFWNEHVKNADVRKLFCESFVRKEQLNLCQFNEEDIKYNHSELDLEDVNENDLTEEEKTIVHFVRRRKRRRRKSIEKDISPTNDLDDNLEELVLLNRCCSQCPCQTTENKICLEPDLYPYIKTGQSGSEDKIGQRILQITNILRNLSFEDENAFLMASNPSMLRFLLITANCSWGQLPQLSYDMVGNVARYIRLHEPTIDPLSSMLIALVTDGLFSNDRFKILRSLEALRELTKNDDNENVIIRYMEKKLYSRLAELLTVSDIMLLIYTLECILALTSMGETVCNDLVGVHGSVSTLVSLVTVEAQSYGPKGCILMRVVETVTGTSGSQSTHQQGGGATTTVQTLSPPVSINTSPSSTPSISPLQTPVASPLSSKLKVNSLPSSSLSLSSTTATGTTVIPPTQSPISTSFNSLAKSLIFPSSTTATPVPIPTLSSSHMQYPAPVSIYDGSHSGTSNYSASAHFTPPTSTLSQLQLPPLTTLSSPSTLSPSTSPTPTAQVPVTQHHNAIGSNKTTLSSSTAATKFTYSTANASENNMETLEHISNSNIVTPTTTANTVSANIANNAKSCNDNVVSAQPIVNNGSPVGATPVSAVVASLAQVSSQSLNQQIFNPSISLVTPRGTLSEEGWAIAWLKGALELASGSSIEEGELYRMYRSARKNLSVILPSDQFTQCVKCAYGSGVGPVIKKFGSTCLTFFDGVRPKIANRTFPTTATISDATIPNPVSQTVTCINVPVQTPIVTSSSGIPTDISTRPVPISTKSQGQSSSPISHPQSALPVSVHIPSRENKTMSPILKATLSRPPKPKNPSGSKGSRFQKGTKEKQKISSTASSCKNSTSNKPSTRNPNPNSNLVKSAISPSSSAIRSLLASKVALRQQKKLQQTKTSTKGSSGHAEEGSDGKVNGIEGEGEESSASSSLNSSEGSESTKDKVTSNNSATIPPPTSFQGILRNGLNVGDFKEADLNSEDMSSTKGTKLKTMLIDLLERKVPPREPVNGLITREIRISDKGLELVDSKLQEETNSNSSSAASVSIFNINTNTTNSISDSQDSQQMTFYSSSADSQITFQGQVQTSCAPLSPLTISSVSSSAMGTVLMSGGGGNDEKAGTQVKTQGLNLVDMSSSVDVGVSIGGGVGGGGNGNVCSGTSASSPSHNSSGGGGDLLEKFNQISDLIVVPPEQLGLKRTHAQSQPPQMSTSEDSTEVHPPPFKKPVISINGNGCEDGVDISKTNTFQTNMIQPASKCPTTTNAASTALTPSATIRCNNSHSPDSKNSTPGANNNQVMQLPLRLSMSSQNSQQLTFGQMRQLVIQSGQHVILPSNNSQSALQGHMIISKSHNSSNDQIPKAIIILSSQQHSQSQTQPQPSSTPVTAGGQATQTPPAPAMPQVPSQNVRSFPPPSATLVSAVSSAVGVNGSPTGNKTINPYAHLSSDQLDNEIPYLCEWSGCGMRYPKPHQVYMHAMSVHCSESLDEAVKCEWGSNGCDPLVRKRYSLMTHLQDRHCSKPALELALYRRRNKIEPPPAPQQPIHHPGYAPNAAFHAIKRHAMQFMNPKELLDDNEGPVTKSIRLTSALILRNLVNFSDMGRKMCTGYESHFAAIAMSNVESSRTIAQILYDMNELDNKSRLLR